MPLEMLMPLLRCRHYYFFAMLSPFSPMLRSRHFFISCFASYATIFFAFATFFDALMALRFFPLPPPPECAAHAVIYFVEPYAAAASFFIRCRGCCSPRHFAITIRQLLPPIRCSPRFRR